MIRPLNARVAQRFASRRAVLIVAVAAVTGLAGTGSGSAGANESSAAQQSTVQLHPAKQTSLGLYVTAREAYEKWRAAPDRITIVDVRTPEEFLFVGHPDMAWNIPVAAQLYRWDPDKRQFPMQPLPDFVARVRQVARPDDTLLVMCRSGGRSAIAVNLLAAAGYKNVYNITDGMEGDVVQDSGSIFRGQHLVNGWKNSGLPWTYDVDPARMLLHGEQ